MFTLSHKVTFKGMPTKLILLY